MGGRRVTAPGFALCAALAWGCAPGEPPPEPEPAQAPQDLAGHPCVGSWSGAPVLYLRLEPDGRYEASLIPNGGGAVGYCLNVVGNGGSSGTWRADGARARLEVEREASDLALSLRGGSVERDGEGLVLVLDEQRLNLRRSAP